MRCLSGSTIYQSHVLSKPSNNLVRVRDDAEKVRRMIYKIESREKVVTEAKNRIDILMSEINRVIKGAESEYLFHIVYLFPNLFATLAKQRQTDEHYFVYNITWLRATNGLTLTLSRILPKFLPLKHLSMLDVTKFEKTFRDNLLSFLNACYDIGIWSYILENKYVDKIIIEDDRVKPYRSEKEASGFQEYVNKAAVSEEFAHWLSWFYGELRSNYRLIEMLDKHLEYKYRFKLNDLVNASMYLEGLAKENRIIIAKNEVHRVFTENIRSSRAEKLLKELTFDKGKDLYRSPLIPLKRGYFLVAKWIFSFGMHFDAWIRPVIERKKIYGRYSDSIGKSFEKYVKSLIEPLVDTVQSNIIITEQKYPKIKYWLNKFHPKKKGRFEIDIVAVKGGLAFLISCKGGKKELPKLQISKMWGEFPEREIEDRIKDNRKDIEEIWIEHECITSNDRIIKDLGLDGTETVPVIVFSTVQPLSLDKLKAFYNIPSNERIVTVEELRDMIIDYKRIKGESRKI